MKASDKMVPAIWPILVRKKWVPNTYASDVPLSIETADMKLAIRENATHAGFCCPSPNKYS